MQRFVQVILLVLLPLLSSAEQRVEVWTYHLSPPFLLGDNQGLSNDFVELLNQDARNARRFHFVLVELPRKRIDERLAKRRPGVLLWATPSFFTAAQAKHATWSAPLLIDQQDFVSLPDAPFDYETPESLHELRLGGILGDRYLGLEDDIRKGNIQRQDVDFVYQNFDKLLSGRIDTLLVPRSTLLYYLKQHDIGDLYISAQPLYQFERHVLFTDALNKTITHYLTEVLDTLPHDPEWQILLHSYGLMPMAPPQ